MTILITPLPTPPTRQDSSNFNDRADEFLGALPLFQQEANTLAIDVQASADDVEIARQAVASVANVTKWISGNTYAQGAVVWSPINGVAYRKMTSAAGGTTDPSLDSVNYKSITDAAGVIYTPAGTGAVATNVEAVLRDGVSLFRFMTETEIAAVKTNTWTAVANVTTSLQKAINHGGYVFAPRGTYLHGTLDFKGKSIILFGEGEDKTIFKANAASVMFDMQDTVDKPLLPLAIRNVKLDGAGIATAGIKTRYRHKTDFYNVTIINVNGDCLNEIDSWNNRRTDLTLYDSVNGLVLQGANHDSAYNGLSISGNSQYQIKIMGGGTVPDGTTALSFNQCDVEYATGDGVYVDSKGLVRFNDCYLGEEIGGKVFDMVSGAVVVSGGFVSFGKNATSYLGYLAGGKLFFNNVNITGGANASVSNMFFSGNGRAYVNDSQCYLVTANAQVMPGDTLDYGKTFECFAPKLGRQYTGFCLNGTFTSTTTNNELTVTCATSTGSPTLLEVHANVTPNWMSGAPGALVIVYKSTKDCSVRLTSGTIGVTPVININGTLPATSTPKTAVFYNWTYTNGVYPTMLEIFQNSTVPGDSLTVIEVFLTDFKHSKPDSTATFYNLAKC